MLEEALNIIQIAWKQGECSSKPPWKFHTNKVHLRARPWHINFYGWSMTNHYIYKIKDTRAAHGVHGKWWVCSFSENFDFSPSATNDITKFWSLDINVANGNAPALSYIFTSCWFITTSLWKDGREVWLICLVTTQARIFRFCSTDSLHLIADEIYRCLWNQFIWTLQTIK